MMDLATLEVSLRTLLSSKEPPMLQWRRKVCDESGLEPVQLRRKFPILNLQCLYMLCFSLPSPSDFKFASSLE